MGGGGVSGSRPPPTTTTTSKLKFDILDLKKKILVRLWGGGGGVSGSRPPPTTTPKPKLIMSSHEMWRHTLVILSNVECARNGWSDVQTPHHHPP